MSRRPTVRLEETTIPLAIAARLSAKQTNRRVAIAPCARARTARQAPLRRQPTPPVTTLNPAGKQSRSIAKRRQEALVRRRWVCAADHRGLLAVALVVLHLATLCARSHRQSHRPITILLRPIIRLV